MQRFNQRQMRKQFEKETGYKCLVALNISINYYKDGIIIDKTEYDQARIEWLEAKNTKLIELLIKIIDYDEDMYKYDSYMTMPKELREQIQKAIT